LALGNFSAASIMVNNERNKKWKKMYCDLFEDTIPVSANSDGVKCKKSLSGYLDI